MKKIILYYIIIHHRIILIDNVSYYTLSYHINSVIDVFFKTNTNDSKLKILIEDAYWWWNKSREALCR